MKVQHFSIPGCFLILLLFINCSDTKTINCTSLRDGIFKFNSPDSVRQFIVTRRGKSQVERKFGTNHAIKYDIKWTSDCNYKLFNGRKISGKGTYMGTNLDTTYCEIISVTGNTHEVITYRSNEVRQRRYIFNKVHILSKRDNN